MRSSQVASRRILANTTALSAAGLWRIGSSFVVQVLVARRLGAAGLGGYALGMALLNVAQTVVEVGLPALLVRELAAKQSARRRSFLLARAVMTTAGMAAALLMLLAAWVGREAGVDLIPYAVLFFSLPFYGLLSSTLTVFEAGERFDLVLLVDGVTNGVLMLATLAVLLLGGGLIALFLTLTLVQAGSALLGHLMLPSLRAWMDDDHPTPLSRLAPAECLALLRRAGPTFGLALTDVLQQRMDLLLVGALATPAVTGLYAAANGLVRVLVKVAQAWWRSLYPTLSRLRVEAPAQGERLLAMTTRIGSAGVVLAALLLTTAAEPMLRIFFGQEYGAAARTLQVLAWSAPYYMLVAQSVILLLVSERPRTALGVALSQVVAVPLLLPWALRLWSGTGAALATLVAAFLAAGVGLLLVTSTRRADEASEREAVDALAPTVAGRVLVAPVLAVAVATFALLLPGGALVQSAIAVALLLLLLLALRFVFVSDLRRIASALRWSRST